MYTQAGFTNHLVICTFYGQAAILSDIPLILVTTVKHQTRCLTKRLSQNIVADYIHWHSVDVDMLSNASRQRLSRLDWFVTEYVK